MLGVFPFAGTAPAEWAFLFPIFVLGLVVILVLMLRWFTHRERMALIERGAYQEELASTPAKASRAALSRGVITSAVGLSITLGLLTIGIGPWLLLGLIPLFIGLALIIAYLVNLPEKPRSDRPVKPSHAENDTARRAAKEKPPEEPEPAPPQEESISPSGAPEQSETEAAPDQDEAKKDSF